MHTSPTPESEPAASRKQRRIGVFGGTFDPIHVGHLIVAEIMLYAVQLEHVIFLPAGRPPHKPHQHLSSDADRLEMLHLALDSEERFSISTIDIDRSGWSYTSESLRIVQDVVGQECELYFLMGQDSLRDFPTWSQPGLIATQARLGVAMRPGIELNINDIYRAVPETRGRIEIIDIPLIGVSSSEIRANVRANGPFRFQVLPRVADYITNAGLYLHPDPNTAVSLSERKSG